MFPSGLVTHFSSKKFEVVGWLSSLGDNLGSEVVVICLIYYKYGQHPFCWIKLMELPSRMKSTAFSSRIDAYD